MKMLIIEYPDGTADCEPYIPMPGQDALIAELKTEIVDSQLLALSYLDRLVDLKIDDEAIKSKIIKALELSNWVQRDAADLVGISPRAFNYYCGESKFNITHPSWGLNRRKNRKSKLKVMRKTA